MPQKKNPDVAELARGKAGRLIGDLTGAAGRPQGPAAGLRPRPAGGQGAGVRRGRHAAAGAAGGVGHDRDDADRRRPAGGHGGRRVRPGDRRGRAPGSPWRAVPRRARGGGSARGVVRVFTTATSTDVSDADLAPISPAPHPGRSRRALGVRGACGAVRSRWHGTRAGRRAATPSCWSRSAEHVEWAARRRDADCRARSTTGPSLEVARDLLGAVLVACRCGGAAHRGRGVRRRVDDPASHAYRGPTAAQRRHVRAAGARLRVLHLRHALLHEPGLRPARATPPPSCCAPARWSAGSRPRQERRPGVRTRDLARGPARLTLALAIDRDQDGADVTEPSGRRCRSSHGSRCRMPLSGVGPRVGVSAGAETPWRLWVDGDPSVSASARTRPVAVAAP